MKKESILDKFMTTKWLAWTFWTIVVVMITALIFYTANLGKETPPIPKKVVYIDQNWVEKTLYTYNDVAQGKAYFQEYDLMDWGTFLGMWAYIGPDFSTDFFHNRAETLYDLYWNANFGKVLKRKDVELKHLWIDKEKLANIPFLNPVEQGAVKEMVKADFRNTILNKDKTVYSPASAIAYENNVKYLLNMLSFLVFR